MQANGSITELALLDGLLSAHLRCPAGLIPAPGQYLLAHAAGSDAPLATAIFAAHTYADELVIAPPIPAQWMPGTRLHLRGPLGHGFDLPVSARRIALIPFESSPRTLLGLLQPSEKQDGAVTLVAENTPDDLPLQVEVQPLHALLEVCRWADFVALDASRESLSKLKELFQAARHTMKAEAQVLVRTPMPCGALAACGVCAVEIAGNTQLACEDGPVFDFNQLMGWFSKA
jgi:dihydroorotate dehydrogenase electron transfer subunit